MVRNSALSKILEKPISGEWGSEGSSVKVIRTTNFTNEGVLDLTDVATRNIDQKKVNKKQLLIGDVIIEKSGGSPTQPVGRVVYFEAQGDYLCNNFTAVLRPKPNEVEGKYLLYMLFANHKYGVTLKFQNKTTGIINLQLNRYLEEVKVPLPPLEEQKKIAAILDAAGDYRQKTKALIEKYDQLTQSLFLDMFGDPVTNPKGWDKVTLPDIVKKEKHSLKRGPFGGALKKEIFVDYGFKVYEQGNAIAKSTEIGRYFIDEMKFKEMIAFKIKPGDFIVSCSGTIGKIFELPANCPKGIINQALMKIDIDPEFIKPVYFEAVFNYFIKDHIFISGSKGSGLKNVASMEIIKSGSFICPPRPMQNQFAERVELIEKQKRQAESSLVKAEELFNSLLQRAFKGELTN